MQANHNLCAARIQRHCTWVAEVIKHGPKYRDDYGEEGRDCFETFFEAFETPSHMQLCMDMNPKRDKKSGRAPLVHKASLFHLGCVSI